MFLGVLYHMTEAVVVPGFEHEALWRFFPGAELNGDVSNWWAPNIAALVGALEPAGFARSEVTLGPSRELLEQPGGPHHYRAVVHALKD